MNCPRCGRTWTCSCSHRDLQEYANYGSGGYSLYRSPFAENPIRRWDREDEVRRYEREREAEVDRRRNEEQQRQRAEQRRREEAEADRQRRDEADREYLEACREPECPEPEESA